MCLVAHIDLSRLEWAKLFCCPHVELGMYHTVLKTCRKLANEKPTNQSFVAGLARATAKWTCGCARAGEK
jgi:hypothetical protein